MLVILLIALGLAQMPAGFPQKGRPAPAFAFADVITPKDAAPVAAADLTPERLRGKVVVLDFFATWCAPCVAAMPHTNAVIEETRDLPVVYLAVAGEDRAVLEKFFETHPFKAVVGLDTLEATQNRYYIRSLPFVVIIDTEGNISDFTSPSAITRAMIEAAIRAK